MPDPKLKLDWYSSPPAPPPPSPYVVPPAPPPATKSICALDDELGTQVYAGSFHCKLPVVKDIGVPVALPSTKVDPPLVLYR